MPPDVPSSPAGPVDPAGESARLRALNAVLRIAAGAWEEEPLLRGIAGALLRELRAERVEAAVRSGDRLLAHRGSSRGGWEAGPPEPPTAALHADAIARAAPVLTLLSAGEGGADRPGHRPAPGHAVAAPLIVRDRVLGSLLLVRRDPPFDPAELELVVEAGRSAGMALERVRLFRRAALDADRLERAVAERAAALQGTRHKLARSGWLTSLGRLAAGVAHDLNNVLNPIVAFAELIKTQANDPEKVRSYADRILMAAGDGAQTVRRIQRFTRRNRSASPAVEVVSLGEIVGEVVELMRPNLVERRAGGPIELVVSVEPGTAVRARAAELREALLNLINNSVDAMPRGGTLRLVGRRQEGRAVLAVQDTGEGMTESVLRRAFEPFFTTKGMHGTGLGLSEVYGIARRNQARLEIESWPGVGTTVLLDFPLVDAPPSPRREPRRPGRRAGRGILRILLIDDNVLGVEATAMALRAAGHVVTTAGSAEEALRLFEPGRYDLVLTDLGLPRLGGWDLVDRIRERDAAVPIGLVTGWPIDEEEEALRQRGIELVFSKPVDPAELLAAL